MKVFGVYSEENKILKDNWFLKTLTDNFELNFKYLGSNDGKDVCFSSEFWFGALRKRLDYFCQAIKDNQGEVILSLDVDIQFFGRCLPIINQSMKEKDVVFQSEGWPPSGVVNCGFMAVRCNEKTLDFYTRVARMEFEKMSHGDQSAVNNLLREESDHLKWGVFPEQIWARSHGCPPPVDIVAHHANCTFDTADKIKQLKLIRRMVSAKPGSPFWIYKKFFNFKDTNIKYA